MMCPKCYAKIAKGKNRCDSCGFNLNELKDASNKQAKMALKTVYRDDVVYTSQLPADVSKKRLLLFVIFLGIFGVHQFYVGKILSGLYNAIVSVLTIVFGAILLAGNIVASNNIFYIIFQFMLVFQGINIILWIKSIIDVATNRFKVPVYKESFSK